MLSVISEVLDDGLGLNNTAFSFHGSFVINYIIEIHKIEKVKIREIFMKKIVLSGKSLAIRQYRKLNLSDHSSFSKFFILQPVIQAPRHGPESVGARYKNSNNSNSMY